MKSSRHNQPRPITRRSFVTCGAAAFTLGAATAVPAAVFADSPSDKPAVATVGGIIDLHHHISPPAYNAELNSRGINEPLLLHWTVEKSLADMDKGGVAIAITSITTPGVWFGDNGAARRLARKCNDFAATLVRDYPARFGIFAALPMPDVDGSLEEIEYAFDILNADGVALMTSFGDKWLGDPAFDPIMKELNRRNAVIYVHPTVANCCANILPVIPRAIIEFGTDTSRAIGNIVFTGTAARYPAIRFIFSHGGGTMPFLYERFVRVPQINPNVTDAVPHGVDYELKRFYYDVAQVANPMALASLTKLIPSSQILFGTDFPYRTNADHVKGLMAYGFTQDDFHKITRENALMLMPRLRR